ncbi:uncharacterized protein [Pyrus communis]|uniref:uncharacterized protein n=1 Tax=Pyrus communis TaxID=23211 RepID=UPI0035C17E16
MVNSSKLSRARTMYGAMAMATAVFAGIYVARTYIFGARKEEAQGPRLTRSMSIAFLHGGQLALQRLLEYHEARADKSAVEIAECELRTHLVEQRPDYKKLQSIVAKLEMSGKEAKAIEILKKAIAKAHNEGKNHEAYENEMLLVEMLIYKGDFEEALGRECLQHVEISDARRPLYKAIIYIMLKRNKDEIIECWKEFNALKELQSLPSDNESLEESQIHKLSTNYEEFEKVVNMLRNDIEGQARKNKK